MKKILIAVGSKKGSEGIVSLFRNLLWAPENIVLLHVEQLEGNSMMTAMLSDAEMDTLKESLRGTEHKSVLDQRAEKILGFYKKALEDEGMSNIRTEIREGHPSEEILKTAGEEAVDLIVVGCSGKSAMEKLVSGCAAKEVEKNATVPVLIAKGDGCGEHAHLWNGRESYAIQ